MGLTKPEHVFSKVAPQHTALPADAAHEALLVEAAGVTFEAKRLLDGLDQVLFIFERPGRQVRCTAR